jgi:hypothetical protein
MTNKLSTLGIHPRYPGRSVSVPTFRHLACRVQFLFLKPPTLHIRFFTIPLRLLRTWHSEWTMSMPRPYTCRCCCCAPWCTDGAWFDVTAAPAVPDLFRSSYARSSCRAHETGHVDTLLVVFTTAAWQCCCWQSHIDAAIINLRTAGATTPPWPMCVVECALALSITSARVPLRVRAAVFGWRRYLLAAHVKAFAGLCRNVRLTVKATKRGSLASEPDAHDWFFHVVV